MLFSNRVLCGPVPSNCLHCWSSIQLSSVQGGPKIGSIFCTPKLYQILTDFQNDFIVRIRRKIEIILSLKIPPHLKCVATLPCEISSVLKATIENKTTSQQETTCLLSQLLSKVTVTSCSFYIKCSMCPPCCWTTHSSRWHHWPMAQSMKRCDIYLTFHKVV